MDTVNIYTTLAETEFLKGSYEASISHLEGAMTILKGLQGENGAKGAEIRLRMGLCLYHLLKYTEANAHLTIAKSICTLRLREFHEKATRSETDEMEILQLTKISEDADELIKLVIDAYKMKCPSASGTK